MTTPTAAPETRPAPVERTLDSLVRCGICQREERVSFAACLRSGWPKCCRGFTMRLVNTDADVGAVTTDVLRAQTAP